MNVRVGYYVLFAAALGIAFSAGCSNNNTSSTPTPTPTISGSFAPDTLWVQDATSRTVRSYRGASAINGAAIPSVILDTSDIANPDVVYDPVTDTLWYPNQSVPNGTNNSIDIWTTATTKNGTTPTISITGANTNNLEGAAYFDAVHNLLVVAHNNTNRVDVYSSATTMTAASVPAGFINVAMTDPTAPGGPRPQEMLYDGIRDILFVADNGTIVAKFPGFGTAAAGLSGGTTITQTATTAISGLGLGNGTGLAYNSAQDILFVTEISPPQIDIIKTASTFSGSTTHAQTLTNFTQPKGLAYDGGRDILYVYDSDIFVFPNATTATGNKGSWPNSRIIFDASTALSGFGITVDTTR
ncbi:MAG: hypothetical protein JOY86_05835 [Candidatus Eremiobacteraeota bacterium]|nr:hypothetical protein [Candidatus Eremiobacteraeota bacterium]